MLLILSSAKTMDFNSPLPDAPVSELLFPKETRKVSQELKKLSLEDIKRLMKVSDKIANLNLNRFKQLETIKAPLRQSIFAYMGDVFRCMDAANMNKKDLAFAQEHLLVMSGLYGALRPLDAIAPYRLELQIKLPVGKATNLYEYWMDKVTSTTDESLSTHKTKVLLNLASKEYSRVIDQTNFSFPIVDVVFKEERNGALKVFGMNAKRARGYMAGWIIKNQIDTLEALKKFKLQGYRFQKKLSTDTQLVFVREA